MWFVNFKKGQRVEMIAHGRLMKQCSILLSVKNNLFLTIRFSPSLSPYEMRWSHYNHIITVCLISHVLQSEHL